MHDWSYCVGCGELSPGILVNGDTFCHCHLIIIGAVVYDAINQTGTCGVIGYIWASGDTGIQEEWTQSIAPIPKEKLEELQHAGSVDEDDGSEEDLNNRPTVPDQDGDSDVSAVEDDDYIKFERGY